MSSSCSSRSLRNPLKSSSELVAGMALTVSPSLIRPDVVELYGNENRPMIVNRSILQSRLMGKYVFTHKAIWAVDLPQTNSTWNEINCVMRLVATVPGFQHWAFVARGSIPELDDTEAYFVAQFNQDSYIPKAAERDEERRKGVKKYDSVADFVENNKRHAALLLCTTKTKTHVWALLPERNELGEMEYQDRGDILQDPEGRLVSSGPGSDSHQWAEMARPLSLGDLNELIYTSDLVGKTYTAAERNCQMFAKSMFRQA